MTIPTKARFSVVVVVVVVVIIITIIIIRIIMSHIIIHVVRIASPAIIRCAATISDQEFASASLRYTRYTIRLSVSALYTYTVAR